MPDEETETQQTAAPPAPAPPVTATGDKDTHAWASQRQRLRDAEQRIQELEAQASRVPQLESQLQQVSYRYETDLAMAGLGGNFQHESVRRMVRREYAEYQQDLGKAAKPFSEWITDEATRSDPVMAPHFASLQSPEQLEEAPQRQVMAPRSSPLGGTSQPAGAAGQRWSNAQILRSVHETRDFASQKDSMLDQLVAEGANIRWSRSPKR